MDKQSSSKRTPAQTFESSERQIFEWLKKIEAEFSHVDGGVRDHNFEPKTIQFEDDEVSLGAVKNQSELAIYEEVKDIPNHPEKYLIDVRNAYELAETGVIPASINIPLPQLDDAFKMSEKDFHIAFNRPKPNKDSILIFSCKSGKRAQRATGLALTHGFKNAKAYKGSWTEWAEKEGL